MIWLLYLLWLWGWIDLPSCYHTNTIHPPWPLLLLLPIHQSSSTIYVPSIHLLCHPIEATTNTVTHHLYRMEPSTNPEVCDMGDQCWIEENGLCSTFFTPTPFSISSPSIYGLLGAHQGVPSRFPPPSQLVTTQNWFMFCILWAFILLCIHLSCVWGHEI